MGADGTKLVRVKLGFEEGMYTKYTPIREIKNSTENSSSYNILSRWLVLFQTVYHLIFWSPWGLSSLFGKHISLWLFRAQPRSFWCFTMGGVPGIFRILSPGRHPRCMLQLSDESLVICDTWSAWDSEMRQFGWVGLDVAGWVGWFLLDGLDVVGMLFPRFVGVELPKKRPEEYSTVLVDCPRFQSQLPIARPNHGGVKSWGISWHPWIFLQYSFISNH